MSVDNSEVLQAIAGLAKTVETYHGDFREFRGEQVAKVEALEENAKDQKFWSRIQVVCVIPVVGALHQIAQHLGWIK